MILEKINQLLKDITAKAAAEQRYYQGALDSLSLLLSEIKKIDSSSEGEPQENQVSNVTEEKN